MKWRNICAYLMILLSKQTSSLLLPQFYYFITKNPLCFVFHCSFADFYHTCFFYQLQQYPFYKMTPKAASLTRLVTICSSKVIMDIADLFIILNLPLETQQGKRKHLFLISGWEQRQNYHHLHWSSENFSGRDYRRTSKKFHANWTCCQVSKGEWRIPPKHFFWNRVFGKSSAEWDGTQNPPATFQMIAGFKIPLQWAE